jgi:hypothetical protein
MPTFAWLLSNHIASWPRSLLAVLGQLLQGWLFAAVAKAAAWPRLGRMFSHSLFWCVGVRALHRFGVELSCRYKSFFG